MNEAHVDILIVGGGTGGCAAALGAASLGLRVILTEETDWLGGQLTAQAVPPDEHSLIERCGCTRRYRQFRDGVRRYYRDHYPLTDAARGDPALNPGGGGVSRLCHEPRVAVAVIEAMMAWPALTGRLSVLLHHKPVAAEARGDRIHSVTLQSTLTGRMRTISADCILDATELGDLLPMAGVEYVSGAESREETGEPHAVAGPAQPDNVQAITWCFAMAWDPAAGANHVADPPADYARWRDYVPDLTPAWSGPLFNWTATHPITLAARAMALMPHEAGDQVMSLWRYRRLIDASLYPAADAPHEATLVNWPQNDYWLTNIIDQPADVVARALGEARRLSLSLFHWMQTEAPRADGGQGYPGLYLRPDLTGTEDGLAKAAYIRESRRIRALFTVTENHVGVDARGPDNTHAAMFDDSVGVGSYRIDLHPSTSGCNYVDIASLRFQIPLGSLIPQRVENLLPACKNLGVTHITNGCYRLHPVEWNIGESAGLLAGFCLKRGLPPRAVHENVRLRREFQDLLIQQGVELAWPENL
ncbi:MAG: FAD-dependent oxidoreductase [Planctomycetes bacterium]|nr:FAD-dependent oxidoreductase [Planctomycetota bacterium]